MKKLLLLLLITLGVTLSSCMHSERAHRAAVLEECVLNSYQMADLYFSPTDTLTVSLRIIEVSKSRKGFTSKEKIKEGVTLANEIFIDALVQFEIVEYDVIKDEEASQNMEDCVNFGIQNNDPKFMNVYVYPDNTNSGTRSPRGRAGSAPGTFLAIKSQYVHTSTLAHELGHLVGLYHIFEEDEDPTGYNSITGDLVCDTYGLNIKDNLFVTEKCKYFGSANYPKEIEQDLIHNIMSYSNPKCRTWITPGQVKRIRAKIADSERVLNTIHIH